MTSNLQDRLRYLLERGANSRAVEVAPGLAVGSVKGPIRKDNQDRAVVARILRGKSGSENLTVAAVFDGMGGMVDGAAAATAAASAFLADLCESTGQLDKRLTKALLRSNDEVFRRFNGRGGTTLSAVAFDDLDQGYAIHVGDSRLYQRTPKNLTLMTTDDTVQGVVHGGKSRDEDDLDSQLIQFVGIGPDIEPHLTKITSGPPSMWIVTTDGAHGLGKQLLQGISATAGAVGDLVKKLMYVADAAGLHDNATAAALYMPDIIKAPPFHSGRTLFVWTPTSSIEIWLDLDAPVPSPTNFLPMDESAATTSSTAEKKPKDRQSGRKRHQKGAAKKSPKSAKAKDYPRESETAPQLNITFGQSRNSNRD